MFDFEKLHVYNKAKAFNVQANLFLDTAKLDFSTCDQFRRASLSIMLNIAEGSGRRTNPEKRRFFVFARGSTFEVVAIIDYLNQTEKIPSEKYYEFYQSLEEISKMLYGMINTLSK